MGAYRTKGSIKPKEKLLYTEQKVVLKGGIPYIQNNNKYSRNTRELKISKFFNFFPQKCGKLEFEITIAGLGLFSRLSLPKSKSSTD
jgi:hypothetical protein